MKQNKLNQSDKKPYRERLDAYWARHPRLLKVLHIINHCLTILLAIGVCIIVIVCCTKCFVKKSISASADSSYISFSSLSNIANSNSRFAKPYITSHFSSDTSISYNYSNSPFTTSYNTSLTSSSVVRLYKTDNSISYFYGHSFPISLPFPGTFFSMFDSTPTGSYLFTRSTLPPYITADVTSSSSTENESLLLPLPVINYSHSFPSYGVEDFSLSNTYLLPSTSPATLGFNFAVNSSTVVECHFLNNSSPGFVIFTQNSEIYEPNFESSSLILSDDLLSFGVTFYIPVTLKISSGNNSLTVGGYLNLSSFYYLSYVSPTSSTTVFVINENSSNFRQSIISYKDNYIYNSTLNSSYEEFMNTSYNKVSRFSSVFSGFPFVSNDHFISVCPTLTLYYDSFLYNRFWYNYGSGIGYSNGYNAGKSSTLDTSWLLSFTDNFLDYKFFGTFSLGNLLAISIAVCCVLIFLKFLAGG